MGRVERFRTLIDGMFASGAGSGAALSIGEDGKEVVRHGQGSTRRVPTPGMPVDDDTWFDVASLTKPMVTVACAMVLVGESRLALDAPIRRWIGDAESTGTVAQLLGHAAGCAAHVEFFRRLQDVRPDDPRRALVAMAAREPAGPPGVASVYSDLGYIQAGAIIERVTDLPLEDAFEDLVAGPLELDARYAPPPAHEVLAASTRATTEVGEMESSTELEGGLDRVCATEVDERGVVQGRVHDENAYFGGGVCGHAGLFARVGDVARFASAIVDTANDRPRGRLQPATVRRFLSEAGAPGSSWRLGWDTPSTTPGISHAGDRWPRTHAVGHLGFTGTSLWLDLARGRWVTLLTNRVHPTRGGASAEAMKTLRRAVNDAAVELLDAR